MRLLLAILLASFLLAPGLATARLDDADQNDLAAGAGDPNAFRNPPMDDGICSWQRFKEELAGQESGGNYCALNDYGYAGKYQMGKMALDDIDYRNKDGSWTGKNGVNSMDDWLCKNGKYGSCSDCPHQEEAFNEWMDKLNGEIGTYGLDKYIGQNIGGKCVVTKSGLLAGRHLKGIGNSEQHGLRHWLESNGADDPTDANGTPVSSYVCGFRGYYTPYDNGASQLNECGGGLDGKHNGGGGGGGKPGAGHGPGKGDTDGDGGYNPRADRVEELREGLRNNWVAGLMLMAEQFTANMAVQVEAIGMMLDAKHQLETQRLMQQKMAEAHKDYHPSEQMCTFGTFARDLANTERNASLTRTALSNESLQRDLGSGDSKGNTSSSDFLSRLKQFRETFCEPGDMNEAMKNLCKTPGPEEMRNRDIDYTRTLDAPMSLKINMTDTETTPDEKAVFALIDNLFVHRPLTRIDDDMLEQKKYQYIYQNMRSVIAMRGIARNSFSNLIALKTAPLDDSASAAPYLKALIKEMGVNEEEVEKILGENPSYYAQMELLTKKIYQNPMFYTNLYDKPTNVERVRAAMRAIKLMNDRDIQAAMLRREMLLSLLLELRLRERASEVYNDTEDALFDGAR